MQVVEQCSTEDGNLVDQIWTAQPAAADGAVTMLDDTYTGENVGNKLQKVFYNSVVFLTSYYSSGVTLRKKRLAVLF